MISLFVAAAVAKPVPNTDSDADVLKDADMYGYPEYGVGYGGYGYGLGWGGYDLVSPFASLRYGDLALPAVVGNHIGAGVVYVAKREAEPEAEYEPEGTPYPEFYPEPYPEG